MDFGMDDASDNSFDWEYLGPDSNSDDEESYHEDNNSVIDDPDEVLHNEQSSNGSHNSEYSDLPEYRDRDYGSPCRSYDCNSNESEGGDSEFEEDLGPAALLACKTNDIETMQNIISTGFNINKVISQTNVFGQTTCLHQAIDKGHFDMVKLLLDSGANLKHRDWLNYGPLHVAIQIKNHKMSSIHSTTCIHEAVKVNDYKLVLLLQSAGAEINSLSSISSTKCDDKVTSLHVAIIFLRGRVRYEMVKDLLAAGSDVRLCHNGDTTLHYAVSEHQCSWKLVKLLLDAGAELNVLNKLDYSPLALAAQSNHLNLLAITEGHKNVAKVLLRNGADINTKNEIGKTLFDDIVSRTLKSTSPNRFDFLNMALTYGANMISPEFRYVLMCEDIELIDWFIKNGLRLQNCGVQFPLHDAIMNPDESILQYLLRTRLFDIDEVDNSLQLCYLQLLVAKLST
ncbi:hypothetical protein QAD02_011148 [Eretmocerus hayati]|uniref:Uncharacterized protein n=1 Tax=Eretmocerus hayati TaxID=131215 RepID=A0ACC2NW99_9HYME|nr:hypothetical protein QAD02_011148 [Eretmocerus hayati]